MDLRSGYQLPEAVHLQEALDVSGPLWYLTW
jgi:hypothetical protein